LKPDSQGHGIEGDDDEDIAIQGVATENYHHLMKCVELVVVWSSKLIGSSRELDNPEISMQNHQNSIMAVRLGCYDIQLVF